MRVMIPFKNPRTNEIKQVKLGFSWVLLLFSGVFGFPLFLRKLYVWGGIMLIMWVINLVVTSSYGDPALAIMFSILFFGIQIWLGIKGDEMTAKNYLESGWEFYEPDSEMTKIAKQKWSLAI